MIVNIVFVILFVINIALAVSLILVCLKLRAKNSQNIATQIEESDEIREEDRKMLRSVFEFGNMITREVMVHRMDMITLDHDDTYGSALGLFIRSGFSRIPVMGENADEILGLAYFKDVVKEIFLHKKPRNKSITAVLRKPLFVPESKPVDDLFRTMQMERQHMALVIDEYGGISGLVTLEDTLEEIVGELDDEHDAANNEAVVLLEQDENGKATSYILPAKYPISDLQQLFGVQIEHDDVDTILGLLTKEIGKVAIKGSYAEINGLKFEAVQVSGRRRQVSKISVEKVSEVEND
ncbi:MAG: hemolysin family protein [Candidatus Ancillula sp.]|nr:hemolysin family protein [Candidatus Ancillula sp.]